MRPVRGGLLTSPAATGDSGSESVLLGTTFLPLRVFFQKAKRLSFCSPALPGALLACDLVARGCARRDS